MTSQKSHLTASAGECCLILAMCLGVPIATSFSAMARYSETTTYAFTDSSFANLIIIEILSLSAAGFALHCKGWRFEDLRMRISIKQSGAGLLLLVVYYALSFCSTMESQIYSECKKGGAGSQSGPVILWVWPSFFLQ